MANEEQLVILKQGVDVWNLWRINNHDKDIDLSYTDLIGADLILANLSDANLNSANLKGADLIDATLILTDLSDANLNGVNLSGAVLFGADLSGAIFKNTKYNKATKWPAGFDPKEVEGLVLCD